MSKLISIIIPCYNLGKFISPCLESIVNQVDDEVEFIFVNDGSTDETGTIIESFCKNVANTQSLHQKNMGVSAARNRALDACSGEYIYLLDGDDILADNAIRDMKRVIYSNPDLVISPVSIDKNGIRKVLPLPIACGKYEPEEFYRKIKIFPTMPKLLYRRDIIEQNHLRFDPYISVGEVYEFTIRFLALAKNIMVVPDIFFHYVMRDSSATHQPNFEKDLTVADTLDRYYSAGEKFIQYSSFNTTAFKMIMSFTYNKYAKLHLRGSDVYKTLSTLFSKPIVKKCIKKVADSSSSPVKERLLAQYVKSSGVTGYKLLSIII